MLACATLRHEAELAYEELDQALREIPETIAWAQIPVQPGAYLHTNGTILGLVQHLAVCKIIYGSTAFDSQRYRWRDCFARLEDIGTSWRANLDYLAEAHSYWMASWAELKDADLGRKFNRFNSQQWSAWKLIATVTQHDAYHGGQIVLLGTVLPPATEPPDMKLDEERKYVIDLPTW